MNEDEPKKKISTNQWTKML